MSDEGGGTAAPSAAEVAVRFRTVASIRDVSAPAWNHLLGPDAGPLVRYEWLLAAEEGGLCGDGTTWPVAHLLVEADGALIGAVPRFRRTDDDHEWVFNHPVREGAEKAGLRVFPRDVVLPPVTPVPGERLLVGAEGALRARRKAALGRALIADAARAGVASVHVLFVDAEDKSALQQAGGPHWISRSDLQWTVRPPPGGHEGWFASLHRKRRQTLRTERSRARDAGITVRWVEGVDADPDLFRTMARLYANTARRWDAPDPLLKEAFFLALERHARPLLCFAVGELRGKFAGLALFAEADGCLSGRYWGAEEEVPYLHFEVALHAAIERACDRGLKWFNPGHGGEHKPLRGLVDEPVFGMHHFLDPRLHRAVDQWERRRMGG